MRKLYDLAAANQNIRFSPYCWRIKMALAHKKLAVMCLLWHFTKKRSSNSLNKIKFQFFFDNKKIIVDSW